MNAPLPSVPARVADRNPAATLPAWLDREAHPFSPRSFATEHGSLRYVDEGAGSPILLVHGTPSWSFEWRHAISTLRGEARCIAPDHLGFGLSDKPAAAPYAPADHAARLLALVRHLDLRDITLVLHDFGGPIGLPIALEVPDRVARVVVMNTWAWGTGDDPRVQRLSRLVRSWLGRWLYLRLNASPRWLLPGSFGDRRKLTPRVHAQYLAPFADRSERTAPWVLGCELGGSDAYYASLWARREALARKPLTIAWGMADPAFDPRYLDRWIEAFPHAEVTRLEGVGHFPQEEAAQAVTALLAAAHRADHGAERR